MTNNLSVQSISGMMLSVRTILNALCGLTILSSSWLAVMFVVLHRPGYERGVSMSLLFVIQGLLTLAVTNGMLSAVWWRILAVAGAVGITWAAGAAVANTLNGPHFEGYALVIGVALILQGVVTTGLLIATHLASSSKVHQFGN
jgi:hypothetical protein